ncbi:MAG: S8 family serine peptidase [Micromonosporaceae bacterium]|nr:S8 family serine peptidase [Micromonosporaceae bacterium]
MHVDRSRRPGSWALVASLALVLVLPGTGAAAFEPDPRTADPAAAPAGEVVLITGDRVQVQRYADGRLAASVEPAAGRATEFEVVEQDGQLYVLPLDAVALVPDVLDPELFNVTKLADYGYTDGVPAILTHDRAAPRTAADSPGITTTATLSSIDGAAVTIAPDGSWWAATGGRSGTAGAAGTQADGLPGVGKLWLDEQAEVALADSAPLIGAPDAWAAGYDGTGLTVAVLDTGIDADHPDLAGKVREAVNFTDEPDPTDQHGHGTHVAGIAAGTGAASGGGYTGVAPGAELLNGKVCDVEGNCSSSGVIAGMEWAAERADVINMSLSTTAGSDGSDPLSQAVNTLTAQHDVLFVTAAGNSGLQGDGTVGAPGSADAALTVGSVDKSEQLAPTSSRGPRLGDSAIKPDVTAPGVGITSARGAGTTLGNPVDANYTTASGTSMATPHVAGAAAILLQQDPDLPSAELKAALATTGVPAGELEVFQQGGGRIDLPTALDAPVLATPAPLDLGFFPYPQDDTAPVQAEVAYTNRTDAPVTLELSLAVANRDGDPAPAGMLSISPRTIEVPPGASATATVTLDVRQGESGQYGGYLLATAGGEVVSRVPVGFDKEQELYQLDLVGIARDGRPAAEASNIRIRHAVDTRLFREDVFFEAGRASLRVPAGTYHVMGLIFTYGGLDVTRQDRALVGDPELEITEDTTLVLDAREAAPVTIDTPAHPDGAVPFGTSRVAYYRDAEQVGSLSYAFIGEWIPTYAVETDPVTLGDFEFNTRTRVIAAPLALSVADPVEQPLAPRPMAGSPAFDFDRRLPLVWAGAGNRSDYDGLDVEGAAVLTIRGDPFPIDSTKERFARESGAAALISMNRASGRYNGSAGNNAGIPSMTISMEEGEQLRALLDQGEVTVRLRGTSVSPYLYDLVYTEPDRIPDQLDYLADPAGLATVVNRFHSGVPTHQTNEVRHHWRPFDGASFGVQSELRTPLERTEYLVPGDTQYRQVISAAPPSVAPMNEPLTFYQPGEHRDQSWFGSPVRPGVLEGGPFEAGVPVVRDGDQLSLRLAEWVDGQAEHWSFRNTDVDTSAFRLYADGELLAEQERPLGTFPMRPEPAEYRLEVDVARDAPWWTTSTASRTAWTVQSQRPAGDDPAVLPLLLVDYDVDLDLQNTLVPQARPTVELQVRHQPGAEEAAVQQLRVWASYDDGGSWQRIPVLPHRGGAFTAIFAMPPPAEAEFASLRVEAVDADGNRIEQEVSRAWRLP